jgi:peptide/nickel transport system substrate-binding protein
MWKDLAIVLNAWGFAAPDAIEATRWFTREQVGVWDWERWHNDEYDELYQQAIGEFDDEKRHKSFVRMQDLMEESGAYLSLSNGIWANLYRDTIRPATSADGRKYLLHHFKRA